jgi:hypothetical protein
MMSAPHFCAASGEAPSSPYAPPSSALAPPSSVAIGPPRDWSERADAHAAIDVDATTAMALHIAFVVAAFVMAT